MRFNFLKIGKPINPTCLAIAAMAFGSFLASAFAADEVASPTKSLNSTARCQVVGRLPAGTRSDPAGGRPTRSEMRDQLLDQAQANLKQWLTANSNSDEAVAARMRLGELLRYREAKLAQGGSGKR